MSSRSVTVFGGTGFLGRQIVRRLVDSGVRVRVGVRNPGRASFPELGGKENRVTTQYADVRDQTSVAQAIAGAEAVVNAVSLYVERGKDTFDSVHAVGAQQVALQAKSAGVERLVLISGIGADLNADSKYVRARAKGETLVQEALETATILRPSVIVGPGDAFFNSLAQIVRVMPLLPLFGRGDTLLQPVYVGDVAAAVVKVLEEPLSKGKIYELGGAHVYRYKTLIELLLKHLGIKRLLLPVPYTIWELGAVLSSILPNPPVTRDQVALMRRDNVVGKDALSFADLNIEPSDVESLMSVCVSKRS